MFNVEKRKNIKKLHIQFGSMYCKVLDLDGSSLSYCNRISPTIGYMTFPERYFEKKTIQLTDVQQAKLMKRVNSIPFTEWKSDDDYNGYGYPGANYQNFKCEYESGEKFEYITRFEPPESFHDMFSALSESCGFSKSELIEIGFTKVVPVPREKKMTIEIKCSYCDSFFYDDSIYCPFCGKEKAIVRDSQREVEDERFEETVSWCAACNSTTRFIYCYCPRCGCSLKAKVKDETAEHKMPPIHILPVKGIQFKPEFGKAIIEGKTAASNYEIYHIERYSATGVYGYDLLQGQHKICTNGNIVLPDRQSIRTSCIETKKEMITEPISQYENVQVTPGLRLIYDVCDESGEKVAAFEKVYLDSSTVSHITFLLPNNKPLFFIGFYEFVIISPENELIAYEEPDPSFEYSPCSLAESRCILKVNKKHLDLLPKIFHAYVSKILRILF